MNPAYIIEVCGFLPVPKMCLRAVRKFLSSPSIQFAAEMDAFSSCVMKNEAVPTPGEMSLRDMRVALAVIESAGLGGVPVKV